jgi:ribonuclease T1
MKAIRFVFLIALAAFIAYARYVSPPAGDVTNSPSFASQSSKNPEATNVPAKAAKALQVLQYVRENGQAPEGYVGGRVFENREGRLPDGGDYREFDVDPHNGQRNAERIIVDWSTKKAWYTGDHYQTFIPMP